MQFNFPYKYIWSGDAGDLVGAIFTNGAPHAPGFPLYTMLGKLLAHLPFGTEAQRISLLSLAFSIATLTVLYNLFGLLDKALHAQKTRYLLLAKLATLSVLFFSQTFLLYSSVQEVFMMTVFLTVTAGYFLIRTYLGGFREQGSHRWFYLTMAVAVFHHYISLLTGLVYATLVIRHRKEALDFIGRNGWKLGVFFLAGIAPYAYFFYTWGEASMINWREISLPGIWAMMTRSEYGFFDASRVYNLGIMDRIRNLAFYLNMLWQNFSFAVLIPAAFGARYLIRKNTRISQVVLFNLFLYGVLLFLYIGLPSDTFVGRAMLERFALLSMPWLMVLFYASVLGIPAYLERYKKLFSSARSFYFLRNGLVFIFLIMFPALLAVKNIYFFSRLYRLPVFENHGLNILSVTDRNSILLLQGDVDLFPVQYLRYVKNYRKDVAVLQYSRMGYDYYYGLIARNYPELMVPGRNEKDRLQMFISENIEHRRIFANFKLMVQGYRPVQRGILYELVPDESTAAPEDMPVSLKRPFYPELEEINNQILFYESLQDGYQAWFGEMGNYHFKKGQYRRSAFYFGQAYDLNTDNRRINLQYALTLGKLNECKRAESILIDYYFKHNDKDFAYALSRLRAVCFRDRIGYLYWEGVYRRLK